MIPTAYWRYSETIPRRNTVIRELARRAQLFQTIKRIEDARVKLVFGNVLQLRLGIMNVINVDALELHVSERLLELVLQVSGRHAMTAAGDIVKRRDARLHESLLDILAHVSRRSAVERQVTTFRADQELIARQRLQRGADRTFAALETIVRGSVDDVRAELNRTYDGVRVVRVSGFVGIAEIRADAD